MIVSSSLGTVDIVNVKYNSHSFEMFKKVSPF